MVLHGQVAAYKLRIIHMELYGYLHYLSGFSLVQTTDLRTQTIYNTVLTVWTG